ncbi:hypothetical protein [Paenibacillus qinlingensis]|uniref:hypothetical protein n=1 Tax=Paenibacillus qinlingensis TaxID=1837343 RepID=UPI001567BDDC|nr:hypothetical protein [Paenibacillus qinlingensis]
MKDETTIPQEHETSHMSELPFNHDYDLMRAYAEQLNGEVEAREVRVVRENRLD